MSPVLKLREGARFAENARFALLQYHPWYDRTDFLRKDDAEVKMYFRRWIDNLAEQGGAPWHDW